MEENDFVDFLKLIEKADSIRKIRMMHLFKTLGVDFDHISECIENFDINIDRIPNLSQVASELLSFRCLSKLKLSHEELAKNVQESQKSLDSLPEDDSSELFELFTSADGSLFSDMQSSVPQYEYENYKRIILKIIKLNLSFNYDMPIESVRLEEDIEDYSNLSDLDFYDKIGQIVDSIDFNRACNTEDKYVLSECQRLLDMINSSQIDDEEVENTNPAKVLKEIAEKLKKIIAERSARLNSPANQGYAQVERLLKQPHTDPDPSDNF